MATKQTSGGVTYDTVTGGPLDEPSALNLDARLREVGARVTAAAAESEARDDTLYGQIQDVRAVAEAGGGGMPDGGQPGQVLTTGLDGKATWAAGTPGPPGPEGDTGPANTLTIGTVTGGAAAGATLTGDAPEQTLSLVLPQGAKGDRGDVGPQGPPGVVSSASAYVIIGPGRPDVPSTTAGAIPSPDTTPVGAEYRSTDGASVGAYVWMKRPGGRWEVTDGDTGVRKLAASTAMTAVYPSTGVYVQRIGPVVYLSLVDLTGSGTDVSVIAGGVPTGFRPGVNRNYTGVAGETNTARVLVMNSQIRVRTLSLGQVNLSGSYPTADPWPTAPLPGTAA